MRLVIDNQTMFLIRTVVILLIILGCGLESAYAQVRLAPEDADRLLLEKAEPIYPAMAKIMKLQDTVNVEITVSDTGSVTGAKLLRGDVVFKISALEAAKKRKYKPYPL